MTTTITDGVTTLNPDQVQGWDAERPSRSVLHPILSRPDPDVTLRPGGLRTGTMRQFYLSYAPAQAAADAQAAASVWNMTASDQAGLTLRYVVANGSVRLSAVGDDLNRWIVEVPYQEVAP